MNRKTKKNIKISNKTRNSFNNKSVPKFSSKGGSKLIINDQTYDKLGDLVSIDRSSQYILNDGEIITINGKEYGELDILGKGGYGRVYTANKLDDNGIVIEDKKYAIKTLRNSNDFVKETKNYAAVMEKITSTECRKYIVGLLEFGSNIMVIEYDPKFVSLDKVLNQLTDDIKIIILRNLLFGIHCIFKAGVIHADVKLDNILVDIHTGEIKYVDFGSAILLDQDDAYNLIVKKGDVRFKDQANKLFNTTKSIELAKSMELWCLACLFCVIILNDENGYKVITQDKLKGRNITDESYKNLILTITNKLSENEDIQKFYEKFKDEFAPLNNDTNFNGKVLRIEDLIDPELENRIIKLNRFVGKPQSARSIKSKSPRSIKSKSFSVREHKNTETVV
jgi:serine/threonine protein kinase